MATITYNPLVDDARRKMGNVVLSKWKKTNYFRKYKAPGGDPSEKQVQVRSAFSTLVEIWQSMNSLFKATWDNLAKNLNMTGFNAFIGHNSSKIRSGEALELFRALGEDPLMSFTATGDGSGTIRCEFDYSAPSAGKHVIFFVQRKLENKGTSEITMSDAGLEPKSPVMISDLVPGGEYLVYAVVTDNAFAEAKTVSASVSASATAGA